ncbi:hypothetical protein [Pseudovibrio ascidiaceicola]|uniref:hypothetical protein n=1 Tax=Pseudovibrio ascidiaceicola TaxID=285279 RepID=UPI000D68CEB5|nr:hypothetical protein [Pseudovibrio ascidiaceicola]
MNNEQAELLELHNLSFSDAFENYVCQSPEVLRAIHRVTKIAEGFHPTFHSISGYCRYKKHPYWGMNVSPKKLSFEFTRAIPSRYRVINGTRRLIRNGRPTGSKEVREYYHAVFERYASLVGLLATGNLVAKGREKPLAEEAAIPESLWSSSNSRIGVLSNNFIRVNQHGWTLVAEGVRIYVPSKNDSKDQLAKRRCNEGRPRKYLWDEAYDELVLILGTKGLPEKGTELVTMYLECFENMRGAYVPDEQQARKWLAKNKKTLWDTVVSSFR